MADIALKREAPPRAMAGYGDVDTMVGVLADALRRGPYLFGETFTAADVVIGAALRWAMGFELMPRRDEFTAYVGRLEARPAFRSEEHTSDLQSLMRTSYAVFC